jgi:acylphosphatase
MAEENATAIGRDEPSKAAGRLEARIRGRVQGVGFRWFVLEWASTLGIVGWVANEPDGSVRCVAEGARPALDRLLERLRRGPPGARIDGVDATFGASTGGFDGFSVRSGAHSGD